MPDITQPCLDAVQAMGVEEGWCASEDDEENPGHTAPYVLSTPHSKSLHFSFAAIQSRMDRRRPELLALEYTRTMMGFLLFAGVPEAVAMIGLGGGSLARFIHKYLPSTALKVVEINPEVIDLRAEFMIPEDGERFRVRLGDGADFVRMPPRLFDVLLVDGFDVSGQPPALATLDFYLDCASALRPQGVAVVNLSPGYIGFERQLEDLRLAFGDHVLLLPDEDCSNAIAFASRTPLRTLFALHGWRCRGELDEAPRRHLMPSLLRVARSLAATRR